MQDALQQGSFLVPFGEDLLGAILFRKRVTIVKFTAHLLPNWVLKGRPFRDTFWETWGMSGALFWILFWTSFWTSFGFILDVILETLVGTLLGRLGAPLAG